MYTYSCVRYYSILPYILNLVSTAVQGGFDTKGYLRRRITAILSIFNFSTRFLAMFLAQIEENLWGRLSGPFLGPGDNFSKSYDENQIRSERQRAGRADPGV